MRTSYLLLLVLTLLLWANQCSAFSRFDPTENSKRRAAGAIDENAKEHHTDRHDMAKATSLSIIFVLGIAFTTLAVILFASNASSTAVPREALEEHNSVEHRIQQCVKDAVNNNPQRNSVDAGEPIIEISWDDAAEDLRVQVNFDLPEPNRRRKKRDLTLARDTDNEFHQNISVYPVSKKAKCVLGCASGHVDTLRTTHSTVQLPPFTDSALDTTLPSAEPLSLMETLGTQSWTGTTVDYSHDGGGRPQWTGTTGERGIQPGRNRLKHSEWSEAAV
eukprot:m.1207604 g.1207604  ORF g.1207604 m.1207604 type:complete len:276 (+) comp24587_c0_seq2:452-1279(+)